MPITDLSMNVTHALGTLLARPEVVVAHATVAGALSQGGIFAALALGAGWVAVHRVRR